MKYKVYALHYQEKNPTLVSYEDWRDCVRMFETEKDAMCTWSSMQMAPNFRGIYLEEKTIIPFYDPRYV